MGRWRCTKIDERGWRIPRPGTASRQIYEFMLTGLTTGQIAKLLNRSPGATAVLAWRIRHPDEANAASYANKSVAVKKPEPV